MECHFSQDEFTYTIMVKSAQNAVLILPLSLRCRLVYQLQFSLETSRYALVTKTFRCETAFFSNTKGEEVTDELHFFGTAGSGKRLSCG